jgi:hypothetical protein
MSLSKFKPVIDGTTGKAIVEHKENGILIEDVDSMAAAQAIALLANLGNLCRANDGTLYITCYSDDASVTTMEQFMEDFDGSTTDDGPSDESEASSEYGPLEISGE